MTIRQALLIDGREHPGARFEPVTQPFDGRLVGEVAVAEASHVELAIEAAARAFESTRRMPTHARVSVLERTSQLLLDRADAFAELIAREAGKPIRFARGEVQRAAITFALAAAECRAPEGEVLPIDLEPRAEGRLCLTRRVPRGPVAAIAPFNFPLNLIAHKLAPAIAVGASVVLKPPSQCPLTGFRLAALLAEAGLPAGALNVVHCSGEHAQRMVEHDAIGVLSFTGSDTVGWKLKALAGKKQVLLELGGNAPCVIDEGIEFERVLDKLVLGAWAYAGQVCIKIQRLFVHASLFERFLAAFVARTRDLAVGDPLDPATVVGPLIEPLHVERVKSWIDEAVAAGARLHCGGTVEGQILHPAVLTDVTPDMKVCSEEVFGPVTVLQPFETFDQALELCNATRFGLQAGVFTRDVSRALRAFRELDYGGVMINEVPTFRVDNFPYGGTKDSGFGREGVRYAMAEMSEPRVLVVAEL
ncbi:MAG TPA: aldehyde dehydrogenase family protein [Planctomycetota bacterium]|nr:aldehyde dehydrogenase family protein [Planctomycetota bacterium]